MSKMDLMSFPQNPGLLFHWLLSANRTTMYPVIQPKNPHSVCYQVLSISFLNSSQIDTFFSVSIATAFYMPGQMQWPLYGLMYIHYITTSSSSVPSHWTQGKQRTLKQKPQPPVCLAHWSLQSHLTQGQPHSELQLHWPFSSTCLPGSLLNIRFFCLNPQPITYLISATDKVSPAKGYFPTEALPDLISKRKIPFCRGLTGQCTSFKALSQLKLYMCFYNYWINVLSSHHMISLVGEGQGFVLFC